MTGIIFKGIGGLYFVIADNIIFTCTAKGIFRKNKITPLPGDFCDIEEINMEKSLGNIVKIHERKNSFIRPPVANIDIMAIVCSVKMPEIQTILIDKMTVIAEKNNAKPIIVINKSDLDEEGLVPKMQEAYLKAGYKVFITSLENSMGTAEFKDFIKGKFVVFTGASGVGKSTLINSISGKDILETGDLSRKTERGRHTTRATEIFMQENGGFIADSPGFTSFEVEKMQANELMQYFPEIKRENNKCRFNGCAHIDEPDCHIKELVEDDIIAKSRYESYKTLYADLKNVKSWELKKGYENK